jgi:hypothetical protein
MITLSYLWRWIRLAGLAAVALVIEHAVIADFWHFALAIAITVGLFVLISAGLYMEWRAHAAGYHRFGMKEGKGSRRRCC